MATEEYQPDDKDIKVIENHVSMLMEHFDSVVIIVTKYDGAKRETESISRGGGNWHSRYGSVAEYLIKSDQHMKEGVKMEYPDEDPNGGSDNDGS